jgi:hypothetical protein
MGRDKEVAKRGPRTLAGKLTISTNAKTHGIRSPRPVVMDFESEKDWQSHRASVLESLAPEGGIEQALAERVASASWRLNRVVVYETQNIAQSQEDVFDDVGKDRKRELRFAARPGDIQKLIEGTGLEDHINPEVGETLSDHSIELVAPPETAIETYKNSRKNYEAMRKVYDGGDDTTLSYLEAAWIFDNAPEWAADSVAYQREEEEEEAQSPASVISDLRKALVEGIEEEPDTGEPEEKPVEELAEELAEKLDERIRGKDSFTAKELRELVAWIAEEAGMEETPHVDGSPPDPVGADLLERLHTVAQHRVRKAEEHLRRVERQIVEKRRERVLPDAEELQKIARYEAHLSREMYKALHELEALQTRRQGGTAPLGRLDVSG